MAGQGLKSLECVRHRNNSLVARCGGRRIRIHDSILRTLLKSFESIFITIKILSFEAKEHLASRYSPAIGGDFRALLEKGIKSLNINHFQLTLLITGASPATGSPICLRENLNILPLNPLML